MDFERWKKLGTSDFSLTKIRNAQGISNPEQKDEIQVFIE
ncbi:hypothetical protein ADIS_4019 [Lunatimonas lonarensis]|uniref:Uncharacterized protein n=1 Tax=Lunatimonas lonarensis TaxID=1232681 RepID=R7ZND3_9BACT|nr:hypothetical protein ADIS_4019 [Lunatimonas lonarensis]